MIRCDRGADIWTLKIDRPDKAGALTREMLLELAALVQEAKDTKALILTGTGKVFSAGADLEAAKAGLATDPVWEELSGALADYQGLSIAALNGTVAGGSFGMVLACDVRISVATANFFYPVMKLGFLPQPSDPARMAALIGPARTKMILMGAQKVGATEAVAWGLIDRICNADSLADDAAKLAEAAVAADRSHVAAIKSLIPSVR
ncbi:enoyl-CoA hydratase/isomerase family protein [Yoonia sediminilitoris]|uniref:Enoyl-CoA hydratase/carnithine racemase n=1 Tax=Yoonia sediminilitoris TaxID=1286148 RepID=A0A2T6K9Y2_9RHOB|nr:enoyl-CoA hydratase/isomerase family protein [Yoonia sediminilitoris]PUB11594.1 enoyl-CoA hydratase/carnithine racemase [Yoonia sediminilitoris]RCW91794.1 enoyl-CoA hydratase/carnithine racemase [Yoonia sediminilitoris]